MTYTEILADLYRRLNYASSPQADVTTRLTAFVNDTLHDLASEPGLGAYLTSQQPPLVVPTVANQATYAVPSPGLERISSITDRSNDRRLEMRSFDWYRMVEPDPTSNTGTPELWVPLGMQAVAKQPSDASQVFADSTSASDTNTAYVQGMDASGHVRSLSVSMTGTTAVTLSASVTLVSVEKFYLSSAAVGTVTLHEDASGGTELARIIPGRTSSRYLTYALWPTPASAIDLYLEGEYHPMAWTVGTDEPPLPARFHHVLTDGAEWRELFYRSDSRHDMARARFEKGVSQLRYFLTCPPDHLPTRSGAVMERSRYGAYYPATRW